MSIVHRKLPGIAECLHLPVDNHPCATERILADTLALLSDEWHIWHRLSICMLDKQGTERTTDADILLYRRDKGFLTIELKAGGISRFEGNWFSKGSAGCVDIKNPVEQVMGSLYALQNQFKNIVGQVKNSSAPEVRWAVCFPNIHDSKSVVAHDLPAERVIHAQHLAGTRALEERLLGIFDIAQATHWQHIPATAQAENALFCYLDGTTPTPRMAELLYIDEHSLTLATASQQRVIESLQANRHLLVEGGPGSGKSLLARWSASNLASQGHKVLLLCYNRLLAEENALSLRKNSQVECRTFHDFARHMIEMTGTPWEVPSEGAADFWELEVPLMLEEALGKHPGHRYDALVVDEAQDLDVQWWPILLKALADPAKGTVRIFRDLGQNLFQRGTDLPEALAHIPICELSGSVRNSRRIAEWLGLQAHSDAPEGAPVQLLDAKAKSVEQHVLSTLSVWFKEGISSSQILVVVCRSRKNSALAKLQSLGKLACWCEANESLATDRVNIVTVHRAKGLEADAVILLDVSPDTPKERILVGGSRAKHLLTVIASPA